MNRHKTKQRMIAMVLSVIMVVGMMPVSALAETSTFLIGTSGEITAFEALGPAITERSVPLGTSEVDLKLPDTLTATMRLASLEKKPMLGSVETDITSGSAIVIDEIDEITVSLPVTWTSSPEYHGEIAVTYIFMPEFPEGIILASGVEVPTITVNVGVAASKGTVIAFDELPDNVRWQNTTAPEFPKNVSGTVEGQKVQIPVTWEADHDYNAKYPECGLYVFTAALNEGYKIQNGVELPRITLYVPQTVGKMMARMAGSGTTDSPLKITTAAQLAEIATLVNARENGLELFLFNNANAHVTLELQNDIDLSAYTKGEGWVPIGDLSNPFKGTFDGGGHKISNLTIDRPAGTYQGLFGYIGAGSVVKNLGVENAMITAKGYVGGMVGSVYKGTIQNCYATSSIVGSSISAGSDSCIGGFAGATYNSTVKNCFVTGSVIGNSGILYTGGVAGYISESTIQNCAALNHTVAGASNVGRVAGSSYSLNGNIAFNGVNLTTNGIAKTPVVGTDKVDGESKAAADIKEEGFFQALFNDDVAWTYAEGKLPGFGVAMDMPEYLVDGSDPNFLGAGTSENPYQITTPAQLAKLAELVNAGNTSYNAEHYKLMNDLDLSGYATGEGWVPIGYDNSNGSFKGTFDGNGHKISNLTIDCSSRENVGLFGYIGTSSVVKNLGVENVYVLASDCVGGVVGYVDNATVQNCYSTGNVKGNLNVVGGVVGYINSGTVQNCYSTSSVSGKNCIGGVVGYFYSGTMQNCYSTGNVEGNLNVGGITGYIEKSSSEQKNCYSTGNVEGNLNVGGIVGSGLNVIVKDCVALNPSINASDASNYGRIVGGASLIILSNNYAFKHIPGTWETMGPNAKDGADVTSETLFADDSDVARFWTTASGFSADWNPNVWDIKPGKLPILKGVTGQDASMPSHLLLAGAAPFKGEGTSDSPYLIKTAADLAKLAELVNAGTSPYADSGRYYRLENDIDLSTYASGEGWMPIGTSGKEFKGIIDGNNKAITGLTINRPGADYIGLFGYLSTGKLQNIRIIDANVSGKDYVGGVAGYALIATVENCTVIGNISGVNSLGGIVGYASGVKLQNCYNSGSVTSSGDSVGGIIGFLGSDTTTLLQCYNDSSVSGKRYVGGVVGEVDSDAAVQNCYSIGNVKGISHVGGVAGEVLNGSLQNCYSTGSVMGTDSGKYIGGVLGYMDDCTVKNCVALNPSIVTGLADNYGRMVGYVNSGTLLNNYAFSRIPGTWANKGLSAKDGADVASKALFTDGFWTATANWDTNPWDDQIWTFVQGKLPVLQGLAGQSGDAGLYLTARDIQYATVSTTRGLTYNGSQQLPTVTVTFDSETLVKDIDYTVSITSMDGNGTSAGTNAGEVTLTLEGTGSFYGKKTVTYTIAKKGITVTPGPDQSKIYGQIDPILTFTHDGGLAPLAFSGQLSRVEGENIGTYAIALGNLSAGGNYALSLAPSTVYFTIEKAQVSEITTTVDNVNTTAYEMRHVTSAQAIVDVAGLPPSVSVKTNGGTASLPITWLTTIPYNAKTAKYEVTGTLTGNENIDPASITKSITVTVTPVTVVNPTFNDTTVITNSDSSATAAKLGSDILPTNGSIKVGDENITYTINWNGGETLDRTTMGNEQTFTGTIGYPSSPAWITLPSDLTVSRKITVTGQTYTVTFNLNGGTRTGGGELIQTMAEGSTAIAPTVSRSGYTFTGWDKAFTNVTSNLTVTAIWRYNGGGGSGGGSSSKDSSRSIIVTLPTAHEPNAPTQVEIKVPGTVDSNGNVVVNITDKDITDAFNKAMAEAKKNGIEQNGITMILRVDTGNTTGSHVMVNLPKSVQDIIIANKIASITVVVDNPHIQIGMDLATVREINRQAKSDVNITATRMDIGKLKGDAKRAIGNRPVFDLRVNYGSNKQVQNFGSGNVSVTILYTLGANEQAGNVQAVYVDESGKVHWLTDSAYNSLEQILRFSTSHFSTYGVGYKQTDAPFKDITGHWAKEDIEFVVSRGLFSGTSNTTFSPNTPMTRGMFVTVLGQLANIDVSIYTKSSFSDVKNDAYYMGYTEWASQNNIINGIGNGRFAPDQSITREQIAVIMSNYAKTMGYTLPKVHAENTFADHSKISTYAKEAVKQIQMVGVISGKSSNLFDPQGTATRAEVSTVMRRFVELANF